MHSCYGGGFAGKGNVEETRLVQLIGTYTKCTSVPGIFDSLVLLEDAIKNGIEAAAPKDATRRVTARDVKAHLLRTDWPLGQPFDDKAVDEFMDDKLKRPDQ
jgi:hypothetical protein